MFTTLRTGAQVATGTLKSTGATIRHLMDTDMIAVFELVALARNPHHDLFPGTDETLAELALIDEGGRMHDDTRRVVLAYFDGTDDNPYLVNPLAEEG